MNDHVAIDETLLQRLPLPLAQLCRRYQNAKTPVERHQSAYFLWEATLKLMASVAVVEYADRLEHDPKIADRLKNLARPALGHWWEFVKCLLPILADQGDPGFAASRDLIYGRARDDMPRAAGLDAALIEEIDKRAGARSTVRLSDLFERLVHYRNRQIGHGALGQRDAEFYGPMARSLFAGAVEFLSRLDVLAGRSLIVVGDVRRQGSGAWLVERYSLTGETIKRIESIELPESAREWLPTPNRVYLEVVESEGRLGYHSLHPLVHFDMSSGLASYLNARRGKRGIEYLCYTNGVTTRLEVAQADHREMLARVLGQDVEPESAEAWADESLAEEPAFTEGTEAAPALRSVGEFEILSRLGQGGMGVVYKAWQPSLGRPVALKCMLRAGDSKAEARFAREIRALGRVEHPNVVKVFTSGSEGEQWFYAMELIEGAELSRVCEQLSGNSSGDIDEGVWQKAVTSACDQARSEELPIAEPNSKTKPTIPRSSAPVGGRNHVTMSAELVRRVAEATHSLHEAGVVHRDIKPGNIMLAGEASHPVLMDLGLAQLADETEGRITRTRQFVGTLRYASPEQILSAAMVDRRTDIYSLGATLWELLTLRPIFGVDDQTSTPELMLKIQTSEPEKPRKHNGNIPRDLEAIVLKCLEKDRGRRYPTAAELAEDLDRFLSGAPVLAQPQSLTYLASKLIRRHKVPIAAAALMIGIIIAGIIAAFIGIDRQRRVALHALEDLKAATYRTSVTVAEQELRQNLDVGMAGDLLDSCPPDLRGWEWDYLMRLRDGDRPPLAEHKSGLWMAALSPDDRRIATVSIDGTLKLWDAVSGKLESSIDADSESVPPGVGPILASLGIARIPATCVEFSPDGKFIASGSFAPNASVKNAVRNFLLGSKEEAVKQALKDAAGIVVIWDAATGKSVGRFDKQLGVVLSLTHSPDGKRIASSSINPENTFVVWDAKTLEVLKVMKGHRSQVHRLRYSPDGRLLVSADTDGMVRFWDATTLEEIRSKQAHPAPVVDVSFSPDGLRFATAGEDGLVGVWETATFAKVFDLRGHTGSALGVAYSPDGKRIASAGFDKTVRLWDASTGKETFTLRGHTDTVWSVSFSKDGRRLVSASFDKTARVWDSTPREQRTGPGLFSILGHKDRVNTVAFSRDGRYLATGGWDQQARLWDGKTGSPLARFEGHTGAIWGLALSPDGTRLATASWDHTVKIWDTAGGREVLTFKGHTAPVHSVAFSPDGKRVVSGGFDGNVRVWEAGTGKVLATCDGFVFPVMSVAFSPDGKRVASGGADRSVKIWDASKGTILSTLKGHEASVHGVNFSPDGKRLVSASWDKTLRVWDVDPETKPSANPQSLFSLVGHTDRVQSATFTTDGSRIASACEDKTVKLWDAKTGKPLGSILHRGVAWSVAFDPDGRRVAVATWSKEGWVKTSPID
jgi:WD40 repeat protein/serine/threonine protein kinase